MIHALVVRAKNSKNVVVKTNMVSVNPERNGITYEEIAFNV